MEHANLVQFAINTLEKKGFGVVSASSLGDEDITLRFAHKEKVIGSIVVRDLDTDNDDPLEMIRAKIAEAVTAAGTDPSLR